MLDRFCPCFVEVLYLRVQKPITAIVMQSSEANWIPVEVYFVFGKRWN